MRITTRFRARVALVLTAMSASYGLAGCAAIDDLRASISRWFDITNFPGEGGVLPGNAPEASPVLPLEKIPKEVSKAPKNKAKTASKLQRPQTVVLPPKKPPISPEMARPEETEGQSAPPATLRLRTRYPEAPPPGVFSR